MTREVADYFFTHDCDSRLMPLEPHEAITEPSPDTVIWRYYSTSQFLWVLQEEALYLSRLDQLDDPFEGYSPVKNLEEEVESAHERIEMLEEHAENIPWENPEERTKEKYEMIRRASLVNCWSEGEEDSLAMWKSYLPSGDGVVVRSTFEKLVEAIDTESNFSYHAGEVTYFDYFEELKSTPNIFKFIMSKPKQYQYENEIRVFVWWPTSGEAENDDEISDLVGIDNLTAPTGTRIDVDLNTLIDGIYVSPFGPAWLSSDYWNNILKKYRIRATAEMSRLAMEPADVLDWETG